MNWNQNIWPDSLRTEMVSFSGNNSSSSRLSSPFLQGYHSFSLGFFGFHYIRAVKDNDLALKRESLRILHSLIVTCNLKEVPFKTLDAQKNRRFSDFRNSVIKKMALSLGDSLGQESQQMLELGFWLAAVHTGLVQAQREGNESYMKKFLETLENGFIPFQYSDIPLSIQSSLINIKELLKHSKKRAILHKCFSEIKALLKKLLLSGTSEYYQDRYLTI